MKKTILALALLTLASAAHAQQCGIDVKLTDLRQQRAYELSWQRVPTATSYIVEEQVTGSNANSYPYVNRFEVSQDQTVVRFKRNFARETTFDHPVLYRVTAVGVAGCVMEKTVTYKTDPTFRKAMVRSVIPLVGSAPGANGAQFKTSLRLRQNEGSDTQTGKLIFHPLGVPASSSDPQLSYSLPGNGGTQQWDDIVAAFGVTGLGSIDIVPDTVAGFTRAVPNADVRLFNVTEIGTFGAIEVQTQPFSFHDQNPESDAGLSVTVPGPDLRLNMGVRVFLDSEVDITVMRNGQVLVDKIMPVQGDILLFTTANAFIGTELQAGDQVFLRVRGDGLPLYTLTDNSTNDPALFFPPTPIQIRVDKAFIVD